MDHPYIIKGLFRLRHGFRRVILLSIDRMTLFGTGYDSTFHG